MIRWNLDGQGDLGSRFEMAICRHQQRLAGLSPRICSTAFLVLHLQPTPGVSNFGWKCMLPWRLLSPPVSSKGSPRIPAMIRVMTSEKVYVQRGKMSPAY